MTKEVKIFPYKYVIPNGFNTVKQFGEKFSKSKIETDDIIYDLINNNIVSFKIPVEDVQRAINSRDFYFKTRNLYDRQIDYIKSMLANQL